MQVNDIIFKELVKRGHSNKKEGTRVWDISDSKLWYLTPELSKGFLNLKKFNPYRKNVVERELKLISKNANEIVKHFGEKQFNLLDLGCGNGTKAEEFIRNINENVKFRYSPVDISSYYIDSATKLIKESSFKKMSEIKPFVSSFEDLDEIIGMLRNVDYPKNLILLLGETLAHYDPNDFLYHLSESMFTGCTMVIGIGVQKGERLSNIEKYKMPLFNDWFIHIMKGLGFKESEVEYDARFNAKRVEGFYKVKVNKTIEHDGHKVEFKKGDEVIVAIQHKYFAPELKKLCNDYFKNVKMIMDDDDEYALVVCRK